MSLRTITISTALAATMVIAAPAHAAVVIANNPNVTSLGSFGAGTYNITATGVISLTSNPGEFDVGPDGVPASLVTAPGYAYCNPAGCSVDIPGGGLVGPGGNTVNFGTVMGTYLALPSSPSDYFVIGNGTTINLGAPTTIYALMNDSHYPNNLGSFDVTVRVANAGVPEPATWAMMLAGFGAIGSALRRRKKARVRLSCT